MNQFAPGGVGAVGGKLPIAVARVVDEPLGVRVPGNGKLLRHLLDHLADQLQEPLGVQIGIGATAREQGQALLVEKLDRNLRDKVRLLSFADPEIVKQALRDEKAAGPHLLMPT